MDFCYGWCNTRSGQSLKETYHSGITVKWRKHWVALNKSASPVSAAALLAFLRTATRLNSSVSRLLRVRLFLFFSSNIFTKRSTVQLKPKHRGLKHNFLALHQLTCSANSIKSRLLFCRPRPFFKPGSHLTRQPVS